MEAAFAESTVEMVFLFYADFPSGAVRVWTGIGNLELLQETWLGVGDLISIPEIEESTDTNIKRVSVKLSGLNPTLLSALQDDDYHHRDGEIYLALVNENGIINDPYLMFKGRLDSDEIDLDSETATVTLKVVDFMADLLKPRPWRYTHEDQQALHPGENDLGLEFVNQLKNLELPWGKPANA